MPGLFATTASADFSSPLREEISPGNVQNLSPRAAWLYLMRLDEPLGFAVRSQLAARTRPRCQFVFLRSRVCYALLSASPRGYALRFATVTVIGSGWLLSSNKILPMPGTLGRRFGAAAGLLPGVLGNRNRRVS